MNYYEKYNPTLLFLAFTIFVVGLLVSFSKKNSSIIDPLVLHLISIASIIGLMMGYMYKHGIEENAVVFLLVYIVYVPALYLFLKPKPNTIVSNLNAHRGNSKLVKLYIISILLVLYSRYDFILYAIDSSPLEWFFYRFKLIENRNPLQYICRIGATSFFYYYSYKLISENVSRKSLIISVLLISLLIDIVAGGRSSMINFILSYGMYLYKFPDANIKSYSRKVNMYGIIAITLSIILAVFVSSMYRSDSSLEDGFGIIINRILAAGDGLEMYLVNHADKYIGTGFFEYVKSSFGIFISPLFNIKTQSFGWRLYELDQGYDSLNSVGPNFILPLQVITLGSYLLLPYVLLIAYLTSRLRDFNLKGHPALNYSVALNAFYLPTDLEFATLIYVSTLAVYLFAFIPPMYVKLGIPKMRFILSKK